MEIKPTRNLQFETRDEELVTLLVPKFQNKYFVRWVTPLLKKKFFHVKLDAYGSFIWNQCNGNKSVEEISTMMKSKFGDDFDPAYSRIQKFIQMFLNDKFLTIGQ
ncbi:MAG: PqqD family protein [Bacteroidota bacterium]